MLKYFAVLLAACTSLFALAQTAPEFLSKAEVTEALSGKAFMFTRRTDGAKIRWEFKSDGTAYGNNRSGGAKAAGNWSTQDDGSVCIKWRGGSKDSCDSYLIKDGQLLRTGGRSDGAVEKAVAMMPD